jgi:hypothetical protein
MAQSKKKSAKPSRVFASRLSVERMRKAQRYFGTKQPGVAIARAIEMAAEAQELAEALRAGGTLNPEDFDERLS